MSLTSIGEGHAFYCQLLNAGKIKNGLGGKIQEAKMKIKATKYNRWIPSKPKTPIIRREGRFINFTES